MNTLYNKNKNFLGKAPNKNNSNTRNKNHQNKLGTLYRTPMDKLTYKDMLFFLTALEDNKLKSSTEEFFEKHPKFAASFIKKYREHVKKRCPNVNKNTNNNKSNKNNVNNRNNNKSNKSNNNKMNVNISNVNNRTNNKSNVNNRTNNKSNVNNRTNNKSNKSNNKMNVNKRNNTPFTF